MIVDSTVFGKSAELQHLWHPIFILTNAIGSVQTERDHPAAIGYVFRKTEGVLADGSEQSEGKD